MSKPQEYDFGGYATKTDLKCSDGRVIKPGAFDDLDGATVPLVYHHIHDDLSNVLGHAYLEARPDGIYCYGSFNDSEQGQMAKTAVKHGDISSLSIYANQLKQRGSDVLHGIIREVSLVLAGANPGAKIDNVEFQHGDSTFISEEDVFIYSGLEFDTSSSASHSDDEGELEHTGTNDTKENSMADQSATSTDDSSNQTIADVFNTLSDIQKQAVYAIIGELVDQYEGAGGDNSDMAQDGFTGDYMKTNVFDSIEGEDEQALSHAEISAVFDDMRAKHSTLKEQMLEHSITNIEVLFPEAQTVTPTPEMIARQMDWVTDVFNNVRKSPFSRVKSTAVNITADEARAKGYVKGAQKVDEVIVALNRVTTPQTIYKKQSIDRDDVIDITDFDVVSFLNAEMRVMLNEEIARAILIGDGRNVASPDKINAANIRPIWGDDAVYATNSALAITTTTKDKDKATDFIDDVIKQHKNYKGSGQPTLYIGTNLLTACRLLKDANGYRLYKTDQELADDLRVSKLVEVGLFDGQTRTVNAKEHDLAAIMVNLMDYTIGADKGGEINSFDDFDIDFNKMKYLIETRCSGALTKPQSAVVFEFEVTTA